MKKTEPKMILNLSIDNEELEEKVKIAMDKYAEQLVLKHLDDTIERFIARRIEKLIVSPRWSTEGQIKGVTLEAFVKERTENVLEEFIEKNAKEILARKIAGLI